MSIATAANLVDMVLQHALLEPARAEEMKRTLQAGFPEPRALARELVRRGWLTPYQINHLFQGRPQDLVLGPYLLLERLGEGGMGEVFKARQTKLDRLVALKVIRKERLANPDAVRRFYREIQAEAQLSHPNIVRALDADQIGSTHFLSMEYVEGIDLAKVVKQDGPQPLALACDYIRQTALGLHHAFERGLVHRDIKPHNLLRTSDGAVIKILDMGLALLAHCGEDEEHSTTLTQEGAVMGTPDYIAPEQTMNSHAVDIRADLYSLGCTFYFLLTGTVPFPGTSLTEKLVKHQLQEAQPVDTVRSGVPAPVAAIIRKLMAKQPANRYRTPAELVAALETWRDHPPVATPLPVSVGGTARAAPGAATADTQMNWPSIVAAPRPQVPSAESSAGPRRWRWRWVSGGLLGMALVVVLLVWLMQSGLPPAPPKRTEEVLMVKTPPSVPQTLPPIVEMPPSEVAVKDPELAVQGEYAGEGPEGWLGAQVIAQGEGQFAVRFWRGGVPGAGWSGVAPVEATAQLEGSKAVVSGGGWKAVISDGRLSGSGPDGRAHTLSRISRKSSTLDARPPAGAIVLFDGPGADEWVGGRVEEGPVLVAGALSKRSFKDFQLHVEYQLPFLPSARRQGRANSGVYLQNRYEVQILDSFGLTPQANDGGAIYQQAAPAVNLCLPPETWQTYDIDFKAARFGSDGKKTANAAVTVRHNGTVIHQNLELKGPTAGGQPEGDTPGPLQLQYHGNAVYFRNIWVVPTP